MAAPCLSNKPACRRLLFPSLQAETEEIADLCTNKILHQDPCCSSVFSKIVLGFLEYRCQVLEDPCRVLEDQRWRSSRFPSRSSCRSFQDFARDSGKGKDSPTGNCRAIQTKHAARDNSMFGLLLQQPLLLVIIIIIIIIIITIIWIQPSLKADLYINFDGTY